MRRIGSDFCRHLQELLAKQYDPLGIPQESPKNPPGSQGLGGSVPVILDLACIPMLEACQAGLSRPVVKLTVRRSHLFEDGLISLMAKDTVR